MDLSKLGVIYSGSSNYRVREKVKASNGKPFKLSVLSGLFTQQGLFTHRVLFFISLALVILYWAALFSCVLCWLGSPERRQENSENGVQRCSIHRYWRIPKPHFIPPKENAFPQLTLIHLYTVKECKRRITFQLEIKITHAVSSIFKCLLSY